MASHILMLLYFAAMDAKPLGSRPTKPNVSFPNPTSSISASDLLIANKFSAPFPTPITTTVVLASLGWGWARIHQPLSASTHKIKTRGIFQILSMITILARLGWARIYEHHRHLLTRSNKRLFFCYRFRHGPKQSRQPSTDGVTHPVDHTTHRQTIPKLHTREHDWTRVMGSCSYGNSGLLRNSISFFFLFLSFVSCFCHEIPSTIRPFTLFYGQKIPRSCCLQLLGNSLPVLIPNE